MEELITKFVEWWQRPCEEIEKQIFHDDLYIKDCGSGNAKGVWLSLSHHSEASDFKLIKSLCCNEEGVVIFEQTDEVTGLYYRHVVYLKKIQNKLIELISTKETVANENKL